MRKIDMAEWWNQKTPRQRVENLLNASLPTNYARFGFRDLPSIIINAMEVECRNETEMTDAEFREGGL